MTEKTLDWLNQNRFRAYPFVNDARLLADGSRVPDCVLLDCLVVDTETAEKVPVLTFNRYKVTENSTTVEFTYNGTPYSYTLEGGSLSGEGSFVKINGSAKEEFQGPKINISLVFSSHEYIKSSVGEGEWSFNGHILPSKVISVRASGVEGIQTQGSYLVTDHDAPGVASGVVHLEDGYRTQPVIQNGVVQVKVGNNYGIDPCYYPGAAAMEKQDCESLLLYFCGQNAINSGNITITGGDGVSISQGREYTAKEDILDTYGNIGIKAGESVPCIEVIASSGLLKLYKPE